MIDLYSLKKSAGYLTMNVTIILHIFFSFHKVLGAYNLANEMIVESKFTPIDKLSLSLCKFCSIRKKRRGVKFFGRYKLILIDFVNISCIVMIGAST